MLKAGDKVLYLGEDISYFKKNGVYTIEYVQFPVNSRLQFRIKECKDPVVWTEILFRKVNGLDRAILKLVKYK